MDLDSSDDSDGDDAERPAADDDEEETDEAPGLARVKVLVKKGVLLSEVGVGQDQRPDSNSTNPNLGGGGRAQNRSMRTSGCRRAERRACWQP